MLRAGKVGVGLRVSGPQAGVADGVLPAWIQGRPQM